MDLDDQDHDQDYDETKALVQSVSVKVCSRHLSTRLEAVEEASSLFRQTANGEVKVGPLKRVAKELLFSLFGGPSLRIANRGEKEWPKALRAFVSFVSSEQRDNTMHLPFHFVSYCAEILSGKMEATGVHDVEVLLQLSDVALLLLTEVYSSSRQDLDVNTNAAIKDTTGCEELITILGDALNKLSLLRGSCHIGVVNRDLSAADSALHQLQTRISQFLVHCPTALLLFLHTWGILPLLPSLSSSEGVGVGAHSLCLPGLAVLSLAATTVPTSPLAVSLTENAGGSLRPVLLASLALILSGSTTATSTDNSSGSITAAQGKSALAAASAHGALICFRRVLGTITTQEWPELENHLIRQLKKNPETSAVLVATGI